MFGSLRGGLATAAAAATTAATVLSLAAMRTEDSLSAQYCNGSIGLQWYMSTSVIGGARVVSESAAQQCPSSNALEPVFTVCVLCQSSPVYALFGLAAICVLKQQQHLSNLCCWLGDAQQSIRDRLQAAVLAVAGLIDYG